MLARVIAALPEVVLLSETNPRSSALYSGYMNPVVQVRKWSPELALRVSTFDEHELGYPLRFGELLECLYSAAEKLSLNLVVRDFNYVDFIGIPFVWARAERLQPRFGSDRTFLCISDCPGPSPCRPTRESALTSSDTCKSNRRAIT